MTFQDLHLGTDMVAVDRIRQGFDRFGLGYFRRLLTDAEVSYCRKATGENLPNLFRRVAGRVAVKEAVSKALGVGVSGLGHAEGIPWHAVETISEPKAPLRLRLQGKARQIADQRGVRSWRVSMAHDGNYALATVIALHQRLEKDV